LGTGKARANLHIKSASLSIVRLCARGKHLVAEMRRLELRQYRKTACLGIFRAQSVLGRRIIRVDAGRRVVPAAG
jgi:hypothetical protein